MNAASVDSGKLCRRPARAPPRRRVIRQLRPIAEAPY